MKPRKSQYLRAITCGSFLALSSQLGAADRDFDNGGGDLKWSTANNWTGNAVPTSADNVFIGNGNNNNWTIALDYNAPSVREVGLARLGSGMVTINQTAGTLQVNSWLNLGQQGGGTGTWNMSGSSVINATHSYSPNPGQTVIGVGFTSSPNYDTGILTLSGTAKFNQTAGDIRIGGELSTSRAKGTVTLNGSSELKLTGTGVILVGNATNGSTGAMTVNNSAIVSAAENIIVSNNIGANGTLTVNDTASITTLKGLIASNGTGNINVTGGTVNANWITLAAAGGVGVMTQSGGAVTLSGSDGLLSIGHANSAQGTYHLNGGTLAIKGVATNSLGASRVFNFNGGTLKPTATNASFINAGSLTRANVRNNGAIIDTANFDVTIGQVLSHSNIGGDNATDGGLTKSNTGKLTLNGANTYNGATTISGGTLELGNALALQNSTLNTTGSVTGGLKTTVTTVTLGGLGGNKNLASVFTTGYSSVTALTLNPGAGATPSYSGNIVNGAANMTLTKIGDGTQTLSGANTYTGATSVNAGTLVVGVGGVGSITSNVTVNSGAMLSGSGTITGAVTVKSGGTHAPGNSPGIQSISGATTYESGSIFAWDLNSNAIGTRGTNYDGVTVTGALTVQSGAIFRVIQNTGADFTDTFWDTNQSWSNIFSVSGTLTGWATNTLVAVYDTTNTLQNVSSHGSFTISGSTLNWSAVPEPSTALAGLLLAAGLLRRRRTC
jgi:autotransporter-associated beta strand protein